MGHGDRSTSASDDGRPAALADVITIKQMAELFGASEHAIRRLSALPQATRDPLTFLSFSVRSYESRWLPERRPA